MYGTGTNQAHNLGSWRSMVNENEVNENVIVHVKSVEILIGNDSVTFVFQAVHTTT